MPLKIVCCCETADYRTTQKKAKWTEMVCKFSVSAGTQHMEHTEKAVGSGRITDK